MPRKSTPKNIAEAVRAALPPVESGVMCVIVRDATLMQHVRTVMQLHVCAGTPIADVPLMAADVLAALYGTGSHDASIAEVLASLNLKASPLPDQMLVKRLPNCRIFNPLSNEGVHVTLSQLHAESCVTAEQSIVGTPREEMIDAIGRLDAGSREQNGLVLLFLYCPPSTDPAWMRLHCDEVFIVDKCEPGPDASVAFSVTALSLESQHANGIGRTMYEIINEGSNWTWTASVFIAAKAEDRAIWFARREGEYLETIAGWMGGVDKSTVKRRQDLLALRIGLDTDADIDPPDGWRDDWFPFLGWNDAGDGDGDDDDDGKGYVPPRPRRLA